MVLEKNKADFSILRRRFKQNTNSSDAEKYRFYGQHYPQLDEFIFKRYFPDVNISGVFVECGANNGQAGSNCKFFEETMGWTGYNIEASPDTFEILQKNRPASHNVQLALSDHCGHIEFALTEPEKNNPAYLGAVDRVISDSSTDTFTVSGVQYRVRQRISVPCTTWRQFIDYYKIQFVDLFILDTEGHEIAVIDGMEGSSVLPALICVEDGWREEVRYKLGKMGYAFDIAHFDNHMYIRQDVIGLFTLRALHKNY